MSRRRRGSMVDGRRNAADLVDRYNADGIGGLFDRPHGGRAPRSDAAQESDVAGWVRSGPERGRTAWCAGAAAIRPEDRPDVWRAPACAQRRQLLHRLGFRTSRRARVIRSG